jgi:hypothetical protein
MSTFASPGSTAGIQFAGTHPLRSFLVDQGILLVMGQRMSEMSNDPPAAFESHIYQHL